MIYNISPSNSHLFEIFQNYFLFEVSFLLAFSKIIICLNSGAFYVIIYNQNYFFIIQFDIKNLKIFLLDICSRLKNQYFTDVDWRKDSSGDPLTKFFWKIFSSS